MFTGTTVFSSGKLFGVAAHANEEVAEILPSVWGKNPIGFYV